ncbi:MAG TPA: GAP family protein [Gaiellaceae bacterium]|nr:GAP family protein [Gaiellaceae bacterium]
MGEIFVLALGSALWPLLIAVTLVALRSPDPPRLLSFFLAGSLLTTISIGVVIVLAIDQTAFVNRSRPTYDPVVYFVAGTLLLIVALVLTRLPERPEPNPQPSGKNGDSWAERAMTRGAPIAFVFGILLNILPGVLPFVALKDIAELGLGTTEVILTVTGFYLVMFVLLEVPLGAYFIAPERTAALTSRFNDWLSANGRRIGAWICALAGVLLVVRGIFALV